VPAKSHYKALDIAPTASADEIKRAFRQQIARYHPDKVQHLGKEFQDMAADRAAELTEAYRILSDEGRRAEYDRLLAAPTAAPASAAGSAAPRPAEPAQAPSEAGAPPPSPPPAGAAPSGGQFTKERATRDEFVRKATIGKVREALAAVGGAYDESPARGFDIACTPKPKLFGRAKGPRLLGRFVSKVDAESIADVWIDAGKLGAKENEELCVLLMAPSVAAPRELAGAIAEQRRKAAKKGAKVTVIPIDARNWDAHMPVDAPPIAKNLLTRLRSGT
jgi:curved DNA-binding protein CbpA